MKLNKRLVDTADPPTTASQLFLRDDELKGFALRITQGGVKSFIIEKRIDNKVKRITLGRYPALTVEQARKEAHKMLGQIATGSNPITEKREGMAKGIKLKEVFNDYLAARKGLKLTTLRDYHTIMRDAFGEWKNKALGDISKDMVAKRHTQLGLVSQARANLAMRLLRAIFTFAAGQYENSKGQSLFPENPVKRLSHTRAWFRVPRRTTVIKAHELPLWYKGLQSLIDHRVSGKSAVIRDYFLLVLFTGLRREEAATLTWSQIDFQAKTLTITDTKNHDAHTLPLSDFLYDLLQARYALRTNAYVFPGDGKIGHIVEPRKVMDKVTQASGVTFTIHDLRRTFITIAESLDIPAYALKRLLNHRMNQDVTAGYIVMDVERLRKPMQAISDQLLNLMNVTPFINRNSVCL